METSAKDNVNVVDLFSMLCKLIAIVVLLRTIIIFNVCR